MPPTDTPQRRGRPTGSTKKPKEPKIPKRMGRPTLWAESHGHAKCSGITAPERFFVLWKEKSFRQRINDLMLALSADK